MTLHRSTFHRPLRSINTTAFGLHPSLGSGLHSRSHDLLWDDRPHTTQEIPLFVSGKNRQTGTQSFVRAGISAPIHTSISTWTLPCRENQESDKRLGFLAQMPPSASAGNCAMMSWLLRQILWSPIPPPPPWKASIRDEKGATKMAGIWTPWLDGKRREEGDLLEPQNGQSRQQVDPSTSVRS